MLKAIRHTLYNLRKNNWSRSIVLCYHRVGNYLADPYNITINNKYFYKQIHWLKNNYNLLSVDDLAQYLREHKSPPHRSVIITFDDGYASTIDTIKLLEEWNVPATFFICTPEIKNRHFYWDILSWLLIERKEMLNDEIELIINLCKMSNISLEPEKKITDEQYKRGLEWKLNDHNSPSNRCEIIKTLSKIIEYEDPYAIKSINNILYNNISINSSYRTFYPPLDQLNLKICNIGGHTMNHYSLCKLNKEMQEKEIVDNKNKIEIALGKKIKYFAYPFGSREHYNEHTIKVVKANYNLAFSNFNGLIHKESNHFELPRFLIRNWELDKFKEKVNNFFENK